MINFQDTMYVFKWFLTFFIIGACFLPFTFSLFKEFKDKGYIFSKIIGIGIVSYFLLIFGVLRFLKFSELSILIALSLFFIINYFFNKYKGIETLSILKKNYKLFIFEELIFLVCKKNMD